MEKKNVTRKLILIKKETAALHAANLTVATTSRASATTYIQLSAIS